MDGINNNNNNVMINVGENEDNDNINRQNQNNNINNNNNIENNVQIENEEDSNDNGVDDENGNGNANRHDNNEQDNNNGIEDDGDGDNEILNDIIENENNNGVIDGGVTGKINDDGGREISTNRDLVLLVEFKGTLPSLQASSQPHLIFRQNITVSIGIEKHTKLSEVFDHYCTFGNSYTGKKKEKGAFPKPPNHRSVHLSDLEFVHCSRLKEDDTAETSALMKNDRIYARPSREKRRQYDAEWSSLQYKSDRNYFNEMRHLRLSPQSPLVNGGSPSPLSLPKKSDELIFHCLGKVREENGYKQEVLDKNVRGYCSILIKRNPWLGRKILATRMIKKWIIRLDNNMSKGSKNVNNDALAKDDANLGLSRKRNDAPMAAVVRIDDEREQQASGNEDHNRDDVDGEIRRVHDHDDVDDDDYYDIHPIRDNFGASRGKRGRRGRNGNQEQNVGQQLLANEVEDDDEDGNRRNIPIAGVGTGAGNDYTSASIFDAVPIEGDNLNHHRHNDSTRNFNAPVILPSDEERSVLQPSPQQKPLQNGIGKGTVGATLTVPLMYPPQAVKLFLEYCYTNRVIDLGKDAFDSAFPTKDINTIDESTVKFAGPVSPYSSSLAGSGSGIRHDGKKWPKSGLPTVGFYVALDGIKLGEEANVPRFSLMCEIAASKLVSSRTVLEGLAFCEIQRGRSGNVLPLLRRSAMLSHVLGRGRKGVSDLSNMPSFNRVLEEKREFVVPSLMMGAMEVMKKEGWVYNGNSTGNGNGDSSISRGKKGGDMSRRIKLAFEGMDRDDRSERMRERLKRRKERWIKRPHDLMMRNPYMIEHIDQDERDNSSIHCINRISVIDDKESSMENGVSNINQLPERRQQSQLLHQINNYTDNQSVSHSLNGNGAHSVVDARNGNCRSKRRR